jgi:ABC-type spermidine/putrescine transport system permease subunit II
MLYATLNISARILYAEDTQSTADYTSHMMKSAGWDVVHVKSGEEAAMDLGAKPLRVFFAITLPIIAPALMAGWLLAFTLSLDDLVVASFVSGPGATTLPMVVYSSVRMGVSPQINALATLIVVFVSLAVAIAGYVMYRQEKIRRTEIRADTQTDKS